MGLLDSENVRENERMERIANAQENVVYLAVGPIVKAILIAWGIINAIYVAVYLIYVMLR